MLAGDFDIHKPIYQAIEDEVANLSYSICFDDKQLDTYSPKITELILRIAVEIEALSIELYQRDCDKPKENASYQTAIKYLGGSFRLAETPIMITSENSYLSNDNRILLPFKNWDRWESKDGGSINLGDWHCAYQMLKHNNLNNKYLTMQKYGTLRYLLRILSALFLLNFLKSTSGRLALMSKLFSIVQVGRDGQYGIWTRSYSGKYLALDKKLVEVIQRSS